MRGVRGAFIAVAVLAFAGAARAEPTDEQRGIASQLFDEGKSLMAAGKVPEGCRKLEESERLAPLPGTVLNLAVCHELEGKLASAMGEFRRARAFAVRDRRDDRVALADQHLAAIAPHISKLVVVVGPDADVPGLVIDCDGTILDRALWGSAVPVDAGQRHLTVSAPDRQERKIVVTVAPNGAVERVTIAPLARALAPLAPLPPRALAERPPAAKSMWTGPRIASLFVGGAGIALLGAGSGLGAHAIQEHDDAANVCATIPCATASIAANDDAMRSANLATTAFVVGAVALVAGAILWVAGKP